MDRLIEQAQRILAYPADDPRATLLLVLAFVALGLLIAVVLLAVASPRHAAPVDDVVGVTDEPIDEDE